MKKIEWTNENSNNASKEGWNVFDCIGSENGSFQIQRNDEDEIFFDDKQVWLFIKEQAEKGSQLHQKALSFIKENNIAEYNSIINC